MQHSMLEQADLAERALRATRRPSRPLREQPHTRERPFRRENKKKCRLQPKDARERLYRMFADKLVYFVEVGKAADKGGANIYLWSVDSERAYNVAR